MTESDTSRMIDQGDSDDNYLVLMVNLYSIYQKVC